MAMMHEIFECVADLCMGRGLTGISAYKLGKKFVGTELNKRRLAVLIDKTSQMGARWSH
jgi:predicted RNA methylase